MQLPRLRLLHHPPDGAREALHREVARLLHDGHDQSVMREIDGDAEIDLLPHIQRRSIEGGVDLREVLQGEAHGAGDEGEIGERDAIGLLEPVLAGNSNAIDIGEVRFDGLEDMRNGPPVLRETIRRLLPDRRERHTA